MLLYFGKLPVRGLYFDADVAAVSDDDNVRGPRMTEAIKVPLRVLKRASVLSVAKIFMQFQPLEDSCLDVFFSDR